MSTESLTYCSATVFGPRVHSWGCTRKAIVERAGKHYCRLHDPVAVRARNAAKDKARKDAHAAEHAIEREGTALAKALGFGQAHYRIGYKTSGYVRELTLSFDEVEQLITKLR